MNGQLSVLAQHNLPDTLEPIAQAIGSWMVHSIEDFACADLRHDARLPGPPVAASAIGFLLRGRDEPLGALIGFDRKPSSDVPAIAPAVAAAWAALVAPAAMAMENAMIVRRAEALSVTDDLTRLYNSRYMNQALRRETKRAMRTGQSLSLLFIDLDGFKAVNDTYGHLCGSRALVEAGAVIRGSARETDVVARYGGDEFSVILPETTSEGATMVAERIRDRIAAHRFLTADRLDVRLTASVGIATLPDVAASAEELVQAADRAMYRVKASGKNGIQIAARDRPRQGVTRLAFRSISSLFSSDLAIDLGTANTCVYVRGKGIVVNEPSIIAINKVNGRVEAVGKDAKEMLGRTPGNIVAIKPMKDGVIADFEYTEKMLAYFIRKAHNNRNVWVRPRIVIGVPSEITQVEKRAVKDSAYRAKASEVHLVEEAMAAAIGAGMPITEPSGNMIVDIGGGTTDIAVISLAGIVYSKAVRVAGNEMDEAIIQYVKKTYNLLIGERTAEAIKMEVGSAYPLEERMTMEIKGRHLIEGVPKTITISDEEIREALAETVSVIVDAVRVALERTPPELSADIVDRGIVLTGGGALLKNLDKRLREETGLPLAMAEDPLSSVVLGAGKMLSDFNLLRKISID